MAGTEQSIIYNRIPGVHLKMTAAWFGYKCLLCLAYFVVFVICAIDAETTPSGSPTLTTAYSTGGFCIANWWPLNQSCYLFTTEKYNFTESKEHCSKQGAHLVSINDEAENEFITSKSDSVDPKWIGLYRETDSCVDISSCAWMWLDESPSGYYNWPIGSLPTPSLCAILEPNGFWANRISCASKLAFICERGLWYLTSTPEATTMVITTDKSDNSSTYSTIDDVPSLTPNKEDSNHSITYIGVGVFLGIIVTAGIVGLVVYFKKCSRKMKNNKPTDVNRRAGADYENVDMSSFSNDLVIHQPSMSISGVYENTLASDTPSRSNNRVDDTGNHPFYERVTHDTDVSPEYARLQFTQLTHTNDSY